MRHDQFRVDFKGKTIGALWNTRPDGDRALQALLRLLREEYGVRETLAFPFPLASVIRFAEY